MITFATDITAEKVTLRNAMRLQRAALSVAERQQQTEVCVEMLLASTAYINAHTILLTKHFGSEMATDDIVSSAFDSGKTVVMPRVVASHKNLQLHRVTPETQFEISRFGIAEPPVSAPPHVPNSVDFVLVPGLAFDRRGHRLGYGGGYYDHLLVDMPRAKRVAIAFDCQLQMHVPTEAHDATIDMLITAATQLTFPKYRT